MWDADFSRKKRAFGGSFALLTGFIFAVPLRGINTDYNTE